MKLSCFLFLLCAVCRLAASGYEYSVHTIDGSHMPIYATSDFESVNIAIRSSLLRDELMFRVEVFVIPIGPHYSVLIGKTAPKAVISDAETEYILAEVRRLLIEAKRARDAEGSGRKEANQTPEPTALLGRGSS